MSRWERTVAVALFVALPACAGFTGGETPANARAAEGPVTVSESSHGQVIELAPGGQLQVVLHSTYWQLKGTSDPSILAAEGTARTQSNRAECLPGAGCGTVTQSFRAVASGRAEVIAERTVCGEALACRADQRRFVVTVVVRN